MWLFFQRRTTLFLPPCKRLLHIAPEGGLERRLRQHPHIDYLSADLQGPPAAMVAMDLTAIPEPDASFDVIYCSHVLEHVPDDRKAMGELARVLRPTGWMVLQVPIRDGGTDEDLSITDQAERRRRFWQHDHVRLYGRDDCPARLAEAGLHVTPSMPGPSLRQPRSPGCACHMRLCTLHERRPAMSDDDSGRLVYVTGQRGAIGFTGMPSRPPPDREPAPRPEPGPVPEKPAEPASAPPLEER